MSTRRGSGGQVERGIGPMLLLSAVLHATLLLLVWLGPGVFGNPPPRPLSYTTVDLVDPNKLGGTNLPGKGRKAAVKPPPPPPPKAPEPPPAKAEEPPPPKPEPAKQAPKPPPEPERDKDAISLTKGSPTAVPATPTSTPAPEKPTTTPAAPTAKPVTPTRTAPPPPQPTATRKAPPPTKTGAAKPTAKPTLKPTATKAGKAAAGKAKADQATPTPAKPPAKPEAKPDKNTAPPAPPAKDAKEDKDATAAEVSAEQARKARDAIAGQLRDQQLQQAVEKAKAKAAADGDGGGDGDGPDLGGTSSGPLSLGSGEGVGGVHRSAESILYEMTLITRAKQNWVWPGTEAGLVVVLRFSIADNGDITNVQVTQPSKDPTFDQSAVRAVQGISPLPAPPEADREYFRDVTLTFVPDEQHGGAAGKN